jgi:hypothetical protein
LAVGVLMPALHPAEVAIICRIGVLQAKIGQELKPNSSVTTGMGGHTCRAETAHLRRQSILTAMPDVRFEDTGYNAFTGRAPATRGCRRRNEETRERPNGK